jgi:hypothetical protein
VQCLAVIVANDPEEAVYLNTTVDGIGQRLTGQNRYVIHFGPSHLPKVEAFWSVSMYGVDFNLVDNPVNRYSIGHYTQGVRYDPDGGLTIYAQNAMPGPDKESNWLPAPKEDFFLILRTYVPAPESVELAWVPSAVERAP